MNGELTHASFFSGVGGLDLGLERAGWRTVSFSEIDPYASAVLAERWPGVPNLGDIVALADRWRGGQPAEPAGVVAGRDAPGAGREGVDGGAWRGASLWSGGFPCQDLSVAGKRAGFAGERSSLAFAFLALVERHRPPAVLLENVPGLLSSHRGRDMAALVGHLAQLGYGWAYRILDARHFGVPQRRRRVFIVALDLERGLTAERAAEVLSVGTRCERHPATGHQAGAGAADGTASSITASGGHHGHSSPRGDGTDNLTVGAIDTALGHHGAGWPDQSVHAGHLIGKTPDPGGVRAPDGLAGRVDDRTVGPILSNAQGGNRTTDLNVPLAFVKRGRAQSDQDDESWGEGDVMPTLNAFDVGDARTTAAILEPGTSYDGLNQKLERGDHRSIRIGRDSSDFVVPPGQGVEDDPLLPLGLDSHRYRCCGNGVVSSVSEWVGLRLAAVLR